MSGCAIIVYMSFANWLLAQLADRNMSQADLSRASGLTKQAITNYVTGRIPDREAVKKIAKALQIPAEAVLRAADYLPSDEKTDKWVEDMDYKINLIKNPSRRKFIESVIERMVADEEKEQEKQRKPKIKPAGT